jgi:two-component system, NarL family, sensor histidine kinase UhpB
MESEFSSLKSDSKKSFKVGPEGFRARIQVEETVLLKALKENTSRPWRVERGIAASDSEPRLRALASYQLQIREDEDKRIAREMHDELGQALCFIDMGLRLLARNDDDGLALRRERIQELIDQSTLAIKALQRISSELRPAVLDHLGLSAAIDWLARETARKGALEVRAEVQIDETKMGKKAATALFRIAQEAMTNVMRHSKASRARLLLREEGKAIELLIEDDGVGVTEAQTRGPAAFGILGMRERAREFGGDLSVEGRPGKGTRVCASLPLRDDGKLP